MKDSQSTTIRLEDAFVPKDIPTFAALIERLALDTNLALARRRDMVSGLRRVAKALGRPVSEVFCDPKWLQPRLERISPAALGLKAKSCQNAVSDAKAAMAYFGIVKTRHKRKDDLSEAWKPLWDAVLSSKDRTIPAALGRFVYFLSAIGVAPDEVSDAVADDYRVSLTLNEISKNSDRAYRAAVNGWNLAVKRIDVWPKQPLKLKSRAKIKMLDPSYVPASFTADLEDYFASRENPDFFAEGVSQRKLQPTSIDQYRYLVLRFLAVLPKSGFPSDDIRSLTDLVRPDRVEAGLRTMLAERQNKSCGDIYQTAFVLVGIARARGVDEDQINRLVQLSKRVAVPRQTGLTAKNRERLRVLQEDQKLLALLELPDRVWSEVRRKSKPYIEALRRETALAILILTFCPIRSENLAEIHIDRNLQRPGDGRMFLSFAPGEVKNDQLIEFELPKHIVRLIDKHLATRVPTLCPSGTPWLFPRRDGTGPVDKGVLAARVSKMILKETGLEVNAHLFRHLAVMLLLDAQPGSYESAKRLLAHSSTSHTISVYSGMETTRVTQIFADIVEQKKGKRK